jgi:hypothetical protein
VAAGDEWVLLEVVRDAGEVAPAGARVSARQILREP